MLLYDPCTVCDYSLDSIDLIAPVYESIDGPSYGNVTITGEGLHILTYTRHPWPLSSEGFLARLNYCNTDQQCIMVFEDPWHSHLLSSILQCSLLWTFATKVCCGWDLKIQLSACGAKALLDCANATVINIE